MNAGMILAASLCLGPEVANRQLVHDVLEKQLNAAFAGDLEAALKQVHAPWYDGDHVVRDRAVLSDRLSRRFGRIPDKEERPRFELKITSLQSYARVRAQFKPTSPEERQEAKDLDEVLGNNGWIALVSLNVNGKDAGSGAMLLRIRDGQARWVGFHGGRVVVTSADPSDPKGASPP